MHTGLDTDGNVINYLSVLVVSVASLISGYSSISLLGLSIFQMPF